MAWSRPTLDELKNRTWSDYASRFAPVAKTPRYNLLQVLAQVDAGNSHLVEGDLAFLEEQIFPDTATSAYLRAHWSDRVPPKVPSAATGFVRIPGTLGESVPAGTTLQSDAGNSYFVVSQNTVGSAGYARCQVQAVDLGEAANLDGGSSLTVTSDIPSGFASTATVEAAGLAGGVDAETDVAYLTRVLTYVKSGARYGKPGDFAAWAMDASVEVTKAFEVKNFGIYGALLIQVIGGNQTDGVVQVTDLATVRSYIAANKPPVPVTVLTPELVALVPSIKLLAGEDTVTNRTLVKASMLAYLETYAVPGWSVTAEALRSVIVDGDAITGAVVTLPSNPWSVTKLQYPILGEPAWG